MKRIEPGSTIGILGSGQLGRMLTHVAHRMGYRVHVFSPGTDTPAGQAANLEITASYDDLDAVRAFAKHCDVATYEFENVPVQTVEAIEEFTPVRPGFHALWTTQHRLREKETLRDIGLPLADFASIQSASDAAVFLSQEGVDRFGILKSVVSGYDGKNQTLVRGKEDALAAMHRIGDQPAVLEEVVDYAFEFSVVGARGVDGETSCFGPILNFHHDHILDVSAFPAYPLPNEAAADALEMTRSVLQHLQAIGVLCVEFFYTTDGRILVNEVAPRPHNSGHLTIEGSSSSQFEQQLRAICGLPLGSFEPKQPTAMANLLGQHISASQIDWANLMRYEDASLHLYGKQVPRSGRKMGHITAQADDVQQAIYRVKQMRRELLVQPQSTRQTLGANDFIESP